MLVVAPVRAHLRLPFKQGDDEDDLIAVVNRQRSSVPAITHVDYSARIQTVEAAVKPDYHALIDEFRQLTGVPMVVNTSFNVRGEPMVLSPEDAYRCFMRTDMDVLVLENCVLLKTEQPVFDDGTDWKMEYELD